MPLLSIITINYNDAAGLKKTIDSVINQTYTEFEYIIIDGGSSDSSLQIIKENANQINYWVSETDKGIYNAMNKGIEAAKGEYLLFLNSGDYLLDSLVLKKVITFMENDHNKDIYYGDLMMQRIEEEPFHAIYPDELSLYHFTNSSAPHQASFIKKSLLKENNGYSENYKIISDWLFFISAWLKNAKFCHMPITVSFFTLDGISCSPLVNNEKEKVYENELSFLKSDIIQLRDYRYFKLSRLHQWIKKIMSFIKY